MKMVLKLLLDGINVIQMHMHTNTVRYGQYLGKYGILVVQVRLRSITDKKLRAVCVRSIISH